MNTAHTPGPWSVRSGGVIIGGPFHQYTNGSAQSQIAMATILANSDGAEEERDANARLIADAPAAALALALICAGVATVEDGIFNFGDNGVGMPEWMLRINAYTWTGIIEAIGWDHAREALAARGGE